MRKWVFLNKLIFALRASLTFAGFHINEATLCGCEIETYVVFEKIIVWATGCPKSSKFLNFLQKTSENEIFQINICSEGVINFCWFSHKWSYTVWVWNRNLRDVRENDSLGYRVSQKFKTLLGKGKKWRESTQKNARVSVIKLDSVK